MNPLLKDVFSFTDEVTLESLKHDLDLLLQNAVALESATASVGLNTRFTNFLNNSFHYFSNRLAAFKARQFTYVKFNPNDKCFGVAYTDVKRLLVPIPQGNKVSWAVWTETLEQGINSINNMITNLLIPTRDAMGLIINHPEKLTNQLVTGFPSWTPSKVSGVQNRFAELTDPRSMAVDDQLGNVVGRIRDIVDTAAAVNGFADTLAKSPRQRGSLIQEAIDLTTEISRMTDLLRKGLDHLSADVKPSPEIIAVMAKRLLDCAEEVEWMSVVIYRREQFAATVVGTIEELQKAQRA